jgi:hypothetical protein
MLYHALINFNTAQVADKTYAMQMEWMLEMQNFRDKVSPVVHKYAPEP